MLKFWQKKQQDESSEVVLMRLSKEFKRALPIKHHWQWDERFRAVLLHVYKKDKGKIVKVLEKYFSDYWNILLDEEMPKEVQQQIQLFDGLRPEQLLFSADITTEGLLYCAWWPWQDGEKISIRIGLFTEKDEVKKQKHCEALLRKAFL